MPESIISISLHRDIASMEPTMKRCFVRNVPFVHPHGITVIDVEILLMPLSLSLSFSLSLSLLILEGQGIKVFRKWRENDCIDNDVTSGDVNVTSAHSQLLSPQSNSLLSRTTYHL